MRCAIRVVEEQRSGRGCARARIVADRPRGIMLATGSYQCRNVWFDSAVVGLLSAFEFDGRRNMANRWP